MYVSVSLFASLLPLPSSVTIELVSVFWSIPALATGAEFAVAAVIVTVSAALPIVPSLTTKLNTYAPSLSAVNVGLTAVALDSVAVLLAGFDVNDQLYVSGSSFASVLPLPFSVTTEPVATSWSILALATGAEFAVAAVIVTVAAVLLTVPSLTIRLNTYAPSWSGVNVGFTAVALDKVAMLPKGVDVNDQVYVSVSLSASVLPLPSSVTTEPVATFWSIPAFATGAELPVAAVIVTVSAALSTVPSFTVRLSTYVPSLSAVNVGLTTLALDKIAALPPGAEVNDQVYVNAFPSASVLPLAFRVTDDPVAMFWSGPAFAAGAVLPAVFPPLPPQAVSAIIANKITTNISFFFITTSISVSCITGFIGQTPRR
jgi:hypothetical protein